MKMGGEKELQQIKRIKRGQEQRDRKKYLAR